MNKTQDFVQTTTRGIIARRAKQLLKASDSIPYCAIAAAINAEFPKAHTTPRSVATMASILRKQGTKIAYRKPGPKHN